jgi:Na+-translocating ferredoxin:NAD+ oxidoreductase RNF subunit RnfB
MSSALNRRGLFALLGRPFRMDRIADGAPASSLAYDLRMTKADEDAGAPIEGSRVSAEVVAVIQGRRCLALTSFCAACVERCPVPGAMHVTNGMPSVVPDVCTGCGICHEVCPAPTNAVLMLPRRKTTSTKIVVWGGTTNEHE